MQKASAKATNTDIKAKKAKRLFFVGLIDLSWRLAAAIIVPVVFGAFLDKKFDNDSFFTIIGLVIGFGLSAWIIYAVATKLQKKTLKENDKDNA